MSNYQKLVSFSPSILTCRLKWIQCYISICYKKKFQIVSKKYSCVKDEKGGVKWHNPLRARKKIFEVRKKNKPTNRNRKKNVRWNVLLHCHRHISSLYSHRRLSHAVPVHVLQNNFCSLVFFLFCYGFDWQYLLLTGDIFV